jgi:hypothetical protein
VLESILTGVEQSRVALAVRDSLWLTASLSGVHLIGVTLVGGAAIVSGLRLGGVLLADQPAVAILRPAGRVLFTGLGIAIASGVLLVAPRATTASNSLFFQLKMSCLVAAAVLQIVLQRRLAADAARLRWPSRVVGMAGALLCFGIIAGGCAFILLE